MKKKKNLIFHFPFLIEKYATGVSWWFLVKGGLLWSPSSLGAAALRESNFNFERCFQGSARFGPPGLRLGTRQQACLLCLEGPCPCRPPPSSHPVVFLFR